MVLRIILSLVLGTALAAFAACKKALTRGGLITAWIFALIITFCAGGRGFCVLAATFVFTVLAGKVKASARERAEGQINQKSGARDAVQMVCNIAVGVVMLLLYAVTGRWAFCVAYGAAMASSLADSLASEIGVLSRAAPVDICTGKKTAAGLSGGVTVLGLGASLLGAAIIGGVFVIFGGGPASFLIITAAGFLGALADSVLGSAVQGKYRCAVCGIETEKRLHCGRETSLVRGCAWINNDAVNFLNNAFAGVLTAAVLLAGAFPARF